MRSAVITRIFSPKQFTVRRTYIPITIGIIRIFEVSVKTKKNMHTARTITSSVVAQVRCIFIINVPRPSAFSMLRSTNVVLIKQLIVIIRFSVSLNNKTTVVRKTSGRKPASGFRVFSDEKFLHYYRLTLYYYDDIAV